MAQAIKDRSCTGQLPDLFPPTERTVGRVNSGYHRRHGNAFGMSRVAWTCLVQCPPPLTPLTTSSVIFLASPNSIMVLGW